MTGDNGARPFTRPSWDEYFIEIAKVVSSRSTCISRRYGAVLVKNHVIVSTGYNGAPRGSINCIDTQKCKRQELNIPRGEIELQSAIDMMIQDGIKAFGVLQPAPDEWESTRHLKPGI